MNRPRIAAVAARAPLRIKLVAALISLLVLGLLTTGAASWYALHNYLVGRVDQSVGASSQDVARALASVGRFPCSSPDQLGQLSSAYVRALDPTGAVVGQCTLGPPDANESDTPQLPHWNLAQTAAHPDPFTVPSASGGHDWRVAAALVGNGQGTVFVATSLADVDSTIAQLLVIELIGGLVVVLLLGALGYALVRRSLRPLVAVEEAAEDIAAGDLTRRVPELDPTTEVGRLSHSFNTMLGRIEAAFRAREESEAAAKVSEERMRRFVADASHELRTPLTSIRGFAELYRQGAVPDPADIGRIMRRIEDQATRMGLLVEDLLMLARLDQQRPLDLEPVDLLTIASEAVQDARALEPDRPVQLVVADAGPPPVVRGDETRLRQVVGNLMSNALTHTPPGTPITVSVRAEGGFGELSVADTGPGMTQEDAEHVFERFYRADSSRTRTSGGTGLGLSIAAALVAAHDGSLTVRTAPGEGATFSLRVPSIDGDLGPHEHADVDALTDLDSAEPGDHLDAAEGATQA